MIEEGAVIGVYRRCKECGQWRSLGYFAKPRGKKCHDCTIGVVGRIGRKGIEVGHRRGYVLTDFGREALKA